ncbi:hypothetical protein CVS40_6365 [Lucilia cuprina]|nr:hypothetical protein CVS40_6365 [Lucilia cuprina]
MLSSSCIVLKFLSLRKSHNLTQASSAAVARSQIFTCESSVPVPKIKPSGKRPVRISENAQCLSEEVERT